MSERVPDYLVERLAAGDLSPTRAEEIRERLRREPEGLARLDVIRASNEDILRAHPPERVSRAIAQEVRRETRSASRGRAWVFALAVPSLAAAFALMLWARTPTTTGTGTAGGLSTGAITHPADDERLKGQTPELRVYRRGPDPSHSDRLREGAMTKAGDDLQLAYVAAGFRYGVVVSIDGSGKVTAHLTAPDGGSASLKAGGEITLPESYELDAAPGFERFVFIVSDAPVSAASISAIVREQSAPPPGAKAFTFTVRKS